MRGRLPHGGSRPSGAGRRSGFALAAGRARSARAPRQVAILKYSAVPEWRNWQTRRTQNPVHRKVSVGSTPSSGTIPRFARSGLPYERLRHAPRHFAARQHCTTPSSGHQSSTPYPGSAARGHRGLLQHRRSDPVLERAPRTRPNTDRALWPVRSIAARRSRRHGHAWPPLASRRRRRYCGPRPPSRQGAGPDVRHEAGSAHSRISYIPRTDWCPVGAPAGWPSSTKNRAKTPPDAQPLGLVVAPAGQVFGLHCSCSWRRGLSPEAARGTVPVGGSECGSSPARTSPMGSLRAEGALRCVYSLPRSRASSS